MPSATTATSAPDLLADVGDLVDEADLGRQEGIGRVLDHLGRRHGRPEHRRPERGVEGRHALGVGVAECPDHDAIRVHEVGDRRALLEELGVRHVPHLSQAPGVQLAPHPFPGADGDRALHRQHVTGIPAHRAELVDDRQHPRQVGVPGVARGRVDRDDQDVTRRHQRLELEGERQPLAVPADQGVQARLVDRHATGVQGRDLVRFDIADADLVPEGRQAHPGDQPNVAGADHADARRAHPATASAGPSAATARTNATSASRYGCRLATSTYSSGPW